MRFRHLTLLISFILVLGWAGVYAEAADDPQVDFKLEKVDLAVYEELFVYSMAGVQESLRREGEWLLSVYLTIAPPWSETIKKLKVDSKEIKVADAHWETTMLGYFDRYGMFKLSRQSLSKSRPYDWNKKPVPIFFSAVFPVPKDKKELELVLGTKRTPIKVPASISKAPDPADTVTVKIASAKLLDEVKNEYRVGDIKPSPLTVTTNPYGRILEVKIKFTPKRSNGSREDHFFWYTPWFTAVSAQGGALQLLGQHFMNKISNNVSNNLSRSSDGTWKTKDVTLYFNASRELKSFKLIYAWSVVAEGQVQ